MVEQRELSKQIYIAQAQLGLNTPQETLLEASRLIDRQLLLTGVIIGHPHIERMFGDKAWLGHLNARRYLTTQGRDQPMTVKHLNTVHKLYLEPTQAEGAGKFRSRNFRGGELDEYSPIKLTAIQRRALQNHPIAGFEQEGDDPNVGYIIYPDYTTIPERFTKLVTDYERQRRKPHEPFSLHSALQSHIIGLHVWDIDMNGRTSRAIMNDGLERDGLPPSTPLSFSDDLYSSLRDWRNSVEEGSAWYRHTRERVTDGVKDPATIFDVKEHKAYYLTMKKRLMVPAIKINGDDNNFEEFHTFLTQIEHGVQAAAA